MNYKLGQEIVKKEKLVKRTEQLEAEITNTINSYQTLVISLEKQNEKQG